MTQRIAVLGALSEIAEATCRLYAVEVNAAVSAETAAYHRDGTIRVGDHGCESRLSQTQSTQS